MQIWHTNTLDPTTSRQSVVSILSEPQTEKASTEPPAKATDTVVPLLCVTCIKPKQKRGNDSISHRSLVLINHGSDSP